MEKNTPKTEKAKAVKSAKAPKAEKAAGKAEAKQAPSLTAAVLDAKGQEVGKFELKEAIFGQEPCAEFLHEFVTIYQANQRSGTANTKTRAEVTGSGKKPWKQKHTGRARAGSFQSPLWRGGGITFGPRACKVRSEIPRQKARAALGQALAAKHAAGALVIVDALTVSEPKTKLFAAALKALKCGATTLVVTDAHSPALTLAGRNISGLTLMLAGDLNAYAVLGCKTLVMTKPALEKLSARWN